jgi:hypothetical protein
MIQFLVRYRRSTGDLLHFEELGFDRSAATKRRLEDEKSYKDDPDVEVVLLTASSRDALVRTHARYFKSVSELAAALGAALPEIPTNGTTRASKDTLNIDEPKN